MQQPDVIPVAVGLKHLCFVFQSRIIWTVNEVKRERGERRDLGLYFAYQTVSYVILKYHVYQWSYNINLLRKNGDLHILSVLWAVVDPFFKLTIAHWDLKKKITCHKIHISAYEKNPYSYNIFGNIFWLTSKSNRYTELIYCCYILICIIMNAGEKK
jgi:hypothetical protein